MAAPGEAQAVVSQSGHGGLIFNNTDNSYFTATFQFVSHTAVVVKEGQSNAIQPFQIALGSLVTEAFPEVNMFTTYQLMKYDAEFTLLTSFLPVNTSMVTTTPGFDTSNEGVGGNNGSMEVFIVRTNPWSRPTSITGTDYIGTIANLPGTIQEVLPTIGAKIEHTYQGLSMAAGPATLKSFWQQYPIITVPQRIRLHNANPQYTAPSTNDQGQIRSQQLIRRPRPTS